MIGPQHHDLVLAVYPFSRGFAFAFLEGPESPFEWGVKEIRGRDKNARTVTEIKKLIDRYHPEVLVMEDAAHKGSRRTVRIRRLYRSLAHLAATEYIDVYRYKTSDIQDYFAAAGARTKFEIAQAIALQIPAFAHRLPPPRKPWMSEDPRQSLFDALALALVFYGQAERHGASAEPA